MEFSKGCIYGIEVKEVVAGVVGTFQNALMHKNSQSSTKIGRYMDCLSKTNLQPADCVCDS